jgi:hypothetical protein
MDTASEDHVDKAILLSAGTQWRKVALIIASVLSKCGYDRIRANEHEIAGRILALAGAGKLNAQGDLSDWRHSEVRRPD